MYDRHGKKCGTALPEEGEEGSKDGDMQSTGARGNNAGGSKPAGDSSLPVTAVVVTVTMAVRRIRH